VKRLRWYDYITTNIYWLGLTTVLQGNGLIVPLLVQKFVGPEQQATAFGSLRLYTLMVALLVQALMGMLSDRSTLRWGRRRPFILVGTLLNMACLIAIGASPSYWFLFAAVVLSQIASNIAHAAQQGLIPDLIPEDYRGRFSGVKSIMELLPVIIVARTVGKLIAAGQMWGGILVAISILFLSMTITMLVHEKPQRSPPGPLDWEPFGRLVAMTLVFLLVILGLGEGVKAVGKLLNSVSSTSTLLIVMGATGLLAMLAAVVVGVWASVRISISSKEARRYSSFPWWVVNRLAFLVGVNNLAGFSLYFLQDRLGWEGETVADPAAQLMMVTGMMVLLSALLSGWLTDHIGRKPLLALSGIVAALGTLILVIAPTMTVVYVGGCIIGAATGSFYTTNWTMGTELVPREEAGRYLGIANLAGAGAGAVGAYIGGPLADYFTVHMPQAPGMGYLLLFTIYGVLFILSTVILFRVKEEKGLTVEKAV
jgi:MFS family permease